MLSDNRFASPHEGGAPLTVSPSGWTAGLALLWSWGAGILTNDGSTLEAEPSSSAESAKGGYSFMPPSIGVTNTSQSTGIDSARRARRSPLPGSSLGFEARSTP